MSEFAEPSPLPKSVRPRDQEEEARMRAILESPSYARADLDPEWIDSPEMRGARLLMEYMKPQVAFIRHHVHSTVVLFVGTRVVRLEDAKQRLEAAKRASAAAPDDAELARKIKVAERVVAKSKYYEVAREFAQMVTRDYQKSDARDYVVVTGGGPGIMEAGNRGAHEKNGKSIGLNITLPHEQVPNSYITPELCFQFRYFAVRKMHFLAAAKAMVAFPGGFGTFDELFEALCLIQTKTIEAIPVVLVGEEFWRKAFDAEFLRDEGVISPEDVDLFSYAETAQEVLDRIVNWYTERGIDPRDRPRPYRS